MKLSKLYREVVASVTPYVDLARPYNAGAVLVAFGCGYYFYKPLVGWHNLLIGLIVVILLHSAFTMQNDLEDLDVDKANHRDTPLTNGTVGSHRLQQVIKYLVFLSLLVAWFSTYKLWSLAFIAAYCLLAWAYNSPPLRGSRRAVASIVLLGPLYTLLPLLAGVLISGAHLTAAFAWFALLVTLNRMSISLLKDFKDASGDKKIGKRTFYLAFGKGTTVVISCLVAVCYYPLVTIFVLPPHAIILSMIVILGATANLINRLNLLRTKDEKSLTKIFQRAFAGEIYFEGALLVCLLAF